MQGLLTTFLITSLSLGAFAQSTEKPTPPRLEDSLEKSLCVEYFHGSLGRMYSLVLNADHSFVLIRRTCEGEIGRASGKWSFGQTTVSLRSIRSKNIPKAFPKVFEIRQREGVPCLVSNPNDSEFAQLGTCVFTAFCPISREDFLAPEKPWPENPK